VRATITNGATVTTNYTKDFTIRVVADGVLVSGVVWATSNLTPAGISGSPQSAGDIYRWGNPCPGGWRLPTIGEFQSLWWAGSSWTTIGNVDGRLFGTAPNQIFLPVAGSSGSSPGSYWSSDEDNVNSAWSYTIEGSGSFASFIRSNSKEDWLSVRCVLTL
jgi:hypothetical protein